MSAAAIQGVRGAFSHAAAIQAISDDVEIVECRTFEELFGAVIGGRAQHGVVPVENTLAGSVQRNMDLLLEHGVHVVAETRVRIRLCLVVAAGQEVDRIRRVASHPVALQQCHGFFARHPEIEAVTAFDTAGSVRDLVEGGADYDAAIGSELSAGLYGADIVERGLEDDDQNFTRFFLIATEPVEVPLEGAKTTVAFRLQHEPGSLHRALGAIAALDVDLTRIESRPIPGRPWEYRFYVDLRASPATDQASAVAALERVARDVRVLGRYREARAPD